jgi:hypothetical protein
MQDFTDSYCERCGTRYTFGPPATKGRSLATARVLARGLKHFVMNDSSTIEDAMTAARVDEERSTAAQITEEFHKVFNFCMTCRQYACEKCWNPNQSACLSCAPLWDTEPVAPEGHLIVRTPASHRAPAEEVPAVESQPDLDQILRQRSADLAAADPGHRTAGEERRAARADQRAADQLRARSDAWKSQDDGWSLWPADEPAAATPPVATPPPAAPRAPAPAPEMNLTPDELLLVQSELDTPAYQEPDEPQPKRPSRTGRRAHEQPEAAQPASAFDLLGSLRQPAEADQAAPTAAPLPPPAPAAPPAGARSTAGRGARPEPSKPARGARRSKSRDAAAAAPTEPWPHATPWLQRPVEKHDWWAESEAAEASGVPEGSLQGPGDLEAAAEHLVAEPIAPAEDAGQWQQPAIWDRGPQPAPEPVAPPRPGVARPPDIVPPPRSVPPPSPRPASPSRDRSPGPTGPEPEFEQSPAAWLAAARRSPGSRRQPESAVPDEIAAEPIAPPPAAEPISPEPAERASWPPPTPAAGHAAPQPPVEARPAPQAEPVPWPPAEADVAASMAARQSLDRAEEDEAAQISAMWVESAQPVLDHGAARVCYRCSLPLSTFARFCRRCGTNQQG